MHSFWFTTLILMSWMLVLSGCAKSVVESVATDTVAVPTTITQLPQPTETLADPSVTAPEQGYPAPITTATIAPTQNAAPYPAPVIATQVVQSSTPALTLQPGENNAADPYPLIDTPEVKQAGSSSASPYPPPAGNVQSVPTVNPLPGTQPVETVPVSTPQAAVVKTQLVATDPTAVNLEAGRPQLVLFFADWCTLCKSVAPVVLNLDSQNNTRMNFIYLDVDDPDTKLLRSALDYTVIAKPRIYLLDPQGVVLRDWIGYVSIEELQEAINTIAPPTP
jgi:thiol-disulfide isomerase/thioredoxin